MADAGDTGGVHNKTVGRIRKAQVAKAPPENTTVRTSDAPDTHAALDFAVGANCIRIVMEDDPSAKQSRHR